MKKLQLDLDKLSVKSFAIDTEDLRGTVGAASYTQSATQCSHDKPGARRSATDSDETFSSSPRAVLVAAAVTAL